MNPLRVEIANLISLERGASGAEVKQEFVDRVPANTDQAGVARRRLPSTSAVTIWTRWAVLSTFAILTLMRERVGIVKSAWIAARFSGTENLLGRTKAEYHENVIELLPLA